MKPAHRALRLLTTAFSLSLMALTVSACGLFGGEDDTADKQASSDAGHAPQPTLGETPTEEKQAEDGGHSRDGEVKDVERCSTSVITQQPGFEKMTTVLYCDGELLEAGVPNTSAIRLASWSDGEWKEIKPTGRTDTGFPCFDEGYLDDVGFPDYVVSRKACVSSPIVDSETRYIEEAGIDEGTITEISSPSCDGRYILIHDSILDQSAATGTEIANALSGHPGWEYTYPGQCSSLRAQLDGVDIYPVYEDFGSDLDAMCAAKNATGGNGRTLNNQGDFGDPCL